MMSAICCQLIARHLLELLYSVQRPQIERITFEISLSRPLFVWLIIGNLYLLLAATFATGFVKKCSQQVQFPHSTHSRLFSLFTCRITDNSCTTSSTRSHEFFMPDVRRYFWKPVLNLLNHQRARCLFFHSIEHLSSVPGAWLEAETKIVVIFPPPHGKKHLAHKDSLEF